MQNQTYLLFHNEGSTRFRSLMLKLSLLNSKVAYLVLIVRNLKECGDFHKRLHWPPIGKAWHIKKIYLSSLFMYFSFRKQPMHVGKRITNRGCTVNKTYVYTRHVIVILFVFVNSVQVRISIGLYTEGYKKCWTIFRTVVSPFSWRMIDESPFQTQLLIFMPNQDRRLGNSHHKEMLLFSFIN